MTPGRATGRLAALQDPADGLQLLLEYAADLQVEHGVSTERADEIAREDLGWLLGELGVEERRRALAYLPEDVRHPILGRRAERLADEDLVELGRQWALGHLRGGRP